MSWTRSPTTVGVLAQDLAAAGAERVKAADPSHSSVVRGLFGRDGLYLVGFALQTLAAPALTPVTTRLLGPGGYGRLAWALALMQVVVPLQGLGLRVGIQKAFLQPDGWSRARRLMSVACLSSLIQGTLLMATTGLWSGVVGLRDARLLVAVTLAWSVTTCVTTVGMGFLRAKDHLWRSNAVYFCQTVVAQTLAIAMCLGVGRTPEVYLAGLLGGQVLALVLCLAAVPPEAVRIRDWPWLRPLLVFSAPLVAQQLSTFVLSSSDRLVIQRYLGSVQVGRYQVSYNLAGVGIMLVSALTAVWISRLLTVDARLQAGVLGEVRHRLSAAMAPVMAALAFVTPVVLRAWVPAGFDPSGLVGVTVWVSLATAPAAAVAVYLQALMIRSQTAWIATLTGGSALLNLALNLVLVPRFGIDGSAGATLFSYGALSAAAALRTRRLIGTMPLSQRLPMLLAAGAAIGSAFIGIYGLGFVLRWLVGLACVIWFGLGMRALLRSGATPSTGQVVLQS